MAVDRGSAAVGDDAVHRGRQVVAVAERLDRRRRRGAVPE
jgi:hypothetical protein